MTSPTLDALSSFCATTLDEHFAAHARIDPAAHAVRLFQRAAARVPAYRAWLEEQRCDPADVRTPADLERVPVVTKEDYLRQHALADLCLDGAISPCDTIAVSSGSTGVPTFFPRGPRHELEVAWRFEQVFCDGFAAHRRRTLAIVCFPLGTWVGGMFTAACCRHLAAKGYPLLVVTPGNQPPEILRAVIELGPLYEQIVLLGYPPFVKDVVDGARAEGIDWSRHRVRLVLAGEIFSEAWRDLMVERAAMGDVLATSASLYGTADAGVLGNETPLSVAIRRFARERPEAGEALFGAQRPPTLVQYDPVDRYFEAHGDLLLFTGEGGGIPLVRYAIGDHGGVLAHATMLERLADFGFDPLAAIGSRSSSARPLPFVFVFGRTINAVSLYGANVFAEVVRLGLEASAVSSHVSGKFVMEVVEDADRNRALVIDAELARGLEPSDPLADAVALEVKRALLSTSGEYRAYVPEAKQTPRVRLWPHAHPEHFPKGVKHRYVR